MATIPSTTGKSKLVPSASSEPESPSSGGAPTFDVLVERSLSAALSAIELYNKPSFAYREEAFAVLMVNA